MLIIFVLIFVVIFQIKKIFKSYNNNFETLNKKVFKKLGYVAPLELIEDTVNCKTGSIEILLNSLQLKMAQYREKRLKSENDGDVSVSSKSKRENIPKGNSSSGTGNKQDKYGRVNEVNDINEQLLIEKDNQIKELQETIEILELKNAKLEQLVRLKDLKIQKLATSNPK